MRTSSDDYKPGDMNYYPKKITCLCCHKTKRRTDFRMTIKQDDGEKETILSICINCRGTQPKQTYASVSDLKWDKGQDISRPSIIDLMESSANQ